MAKKKGTKFTVKNESPVPGESEKTTRNSTVVFRPEHWEFRKVLHLLLEDHPDLEPARWCLDLMNGTYDEYGVAVSRYIPFVLEYFVDTERSKKDVVCLWVISNWWHFWGYGPRPDTRRRPKTRMVTTDDAWMTDLQCPVCNRIYDVPKELKVRNDIIRAYSEWLLVHAKECQAPLSKYQQRKAEREASEYKRLTDESFADYTKRLRLLKLEGEQAEQALKQSLEVIGKLERENFDLQADRRDREYFYENLWQAREQVEETKIKVGLSQTEYWELQRIRELRNNWEIRAEQLSKHLEIRGTKTQLKLAQKAIRDLVKKEKLLLQKVGISE